MPAALGEEKRQAEEVATWMQMFLQTVCWAFRSSRSDFLGKKPWEKHLNFFWVWEKGQVTRCFFVKEAFCCENQGLGVSLPERWTPSTRARVKFHTVGEPWWRPMFGLSAYFVQAWSYPVPDTYPTKLEAWTAASKSLRSAIQTAQL